MLVINASFILAIDMYVPALPLLLEEFDTSASFLNLTMFMFMLVSAFAILVAGPLTDKFGRKPILIVSCAVFGASSIGCALSTSVLMLTVFRVGQAIGFGLVETDVTAMIKDAYTDKDLKFAMSLLQSLVIVGPVLAPFLGTLLLAIGGWREIFVALAVMGIIGLVIALVISETMHADHRLAAGVVPALRDMMMRVRSLLSKRSFTAMALIVGVAGLAYMGYIAVASYILLDDFDSGYVIYNLVYAGICGVSVLAPFVYLRISKMMSPRALTVLCAVLGLVAAAFMAVFGIWGPFAFFCCFVPYALMEGIIRPHAFVVLLDQPPDQVGSASAFANFVYTMLGAAGTVVMTLPWTSYVGGLAIVMGACSIIMLALYAWGLRK
ncbi:MAG TPA: MFS transporter [Coriobacteriaceae bacterium]|nr:MFS transporter [Coriobacteriaceae bacterium]